VVVVVAVVIAVVVAIAAVSSTVTQCPRQQQVNGLELAVKSFVE
jgi:hypothetical protein